MLDNVRTFNIFRSHLECQEHAGGQDSKTCDLLRFSIVLIWRAHSSLKPVLVGGTVNLPQRREHMISFYFQHFLPSKGHASKSTAGYLWSFVYIFDSLQTIVILKFSELPLNSEINDQLAWRFMIRHFCCVNVWFICIYNYIYTSSHHHSIRPVEPRDCLPQLFVKPTWKWKTHGSWQFHNSLKAKRSPKVCDKARRLGTTSTKSQFRGHFEQMKDISMCHQNEFHSMQLLGCLVVLSFFNWASHSLTFPHRWSPDVGWKWEKIDDDLEAAAVEGAEKSMDEVKI